jgi:hypothetical protein
MVSRQREWQLRTKAAGRCVLCGVKRGKRGTNHHCRSCADAVNQYNRQRYKEQKAEPVRAYARSKHG